MQGNGNGTEARILDRAKSLLYTERWDSYGDPKIMVRKIAQIWGAILGHPVSERQVTLMMAGLKLARDTAKADDENLSDGAAYLEMASFFPPKNGEKPKGSVKVEHHKVGGYHQEGATPTP